MRLTDILQPDCVLVPLQAQSKQEAIFALTDLMVANSPISEGDQLKQAIWQRETTRTTGIGHGIAIPHGKSGGVDQLRMAIGRTAEPINFGAIDGQGVDLVMLLASPIDQTGPHIQALATISRILTDEDLRTALKQADSAEQLYQLIAKHEAQNAAR